MRQTKGKRSEEEEEEEEEEKIPRYFDLFTTKEVNPEKVVSLRPGPHITHSTQLSHR